MPINETKLVNPRPALPLVKFTWSPVGAALVYIVGGNSYAYGSYDPRMQAFITPTNTPITFVANVTSVSSISIIKYVWDFGDGQFGAGQNVQHTYTAPVPSTEVSLTVTDSLGRQSTRSKVLNLRHSNQVGVNTFVTRVLP
jgi:PKD repeat protein